MQYEHDCIECEPIFSTVNSRGEVKDWYIHRRDDGDHSIIARVSDEPSGYWSTRLSTLSILCKRHIVNEDTTFDETAMIAEKIVSDLLLSESG